MGLSRNQPHIYFSKLQSMAIIYYSMVRGLQLFYPLFYKYLKLDLKSCHKFLHLLFINFLSKDGLFHAIIQIANQQIIFIRFHLPLPMPKTLNAVIFLLDLWWKLENIFLNLFCQFLWSILIFISLPHRFHLFLDFYLQHKV